MATCALRDICAVLPRSLKCTSSRETSEAVCQITDIPCVGLALGLTAQSEKEVPVKVSRLAGKLCVLGLSAMLLSACNGVSDSLGEAGATSTGGSTASDTVSFAASTFAVSQTDGT